MISSSTVDICQDGPQWPLPPGIHGLVYLVNCFQWTGYSKSDGLSLPRLGYKKIVASILCSSVLSWLLPLRETRYHVVSWPVERPIWQGTKGGFLWTGSEELGPYSPGGSESESWATTVCMSLEVNLPPVEPWDDFSPGQCLQATL